MNEDQNGLVIDRFLMSISNGLLYACPGYSLIASIDLLRRAECKIRRLPQPTIVHPIKWIDIPTMYREFNGGVCIDTL